MPAVGSALRAIVLLASAAVAVVLPVGSVAAHTDLDFTLPAEGSTVGQPVTEITVAFTDPVALVGNGFEVLDPQGNVIQPFAVTDDDMVFRLQLDPPLAGGAVGVRYEVTAADGHVIEGAFSFTAAAPPPTAAPTSAPADAPVTVPLTAPPPVSVPATAPTTTSTVATTITPTPISVPPTSAAGDADSDADSDDDSDGDAVRTVVIAMLVASALGTAGLLIVRARRTP